MNKGLDALERVRKAQYVSSIVMQLPHEDTETIEAINVIEKELKEYQEIKDIAKHYNWDDITSKIFNVETDKKYRDLFDSAIVNIQEDYRKARALDIVLRFSFYDMYFLDYILSEGKITQKEYDLLKEVLL